jgi:subtilase family serine protease
MSMPYPFLDSRRRACLLFTVLLLLLTGCAGFGNTRTPLNTTRQSSPIRHDPADVCPDQLKNIPDCQTPHSMRVAYGMESLIEQGMTGKGQTVVDIVSFGSPTLQHDIDVFDKQFNLPPITIQVMSPIGTVKFDPANKDMTSWAEETTLDVEIIHAMAPGANIVVLTSPVAETEGTIGLPQFLQLEHYAVDHHLGQIFSQSYVASEVTLTDKAGRDLVANYTDFYKQIAQQGWTVLTGSGDHGVTDYKDLAATQFATAPTVNFPADVPWVTAVGGTALVNSANGVNETAWSGSGGGFSKFFSEPDYQHLLPASVQSQFKGQRGIPDVAANADPGTAMAIYFNGAWEQIGGTSAATPTWAGIIAVADQMAGHPLGFLNPALYKIATSGKAAQDFRDITSGDNSFSQGSVSVQGYTAATGWDAITGIGTPLGNKLLPDLIAQTKSS